jgi:hypothetical protein
MSREGLYKALSADGNPSFATIIKVAKAPARDGPSRGRNRAAGAAKERELHVTSWPPPAAPGHSKMGRALGWWT